MPTKARPLSENTIDYGNRYSLAQRIQALILITDGFKPEVIKEKTGVKRRTQFNIKKKTVERGFNPKVDP